MTRVKICGITSLEDALAAVEAGADALGFVFAEEARDRNRYIAPEAARAIIDKLPPWVITVGVVVEEPLDTLRQLLQFLDRVQVHGDRAEETALALGPRVIPAFRVRSNFSIMQHHPERFSACLLDAYVPGKHGGTGQTFDWNLARTAAAGCRIILAGGLTPENVGEAVRQVQPYGVDTSGGVERAPGIKDHDRIRAFIHNAKTPLS